MCIAVKKASVNTCAWGSATTAQRKGCARVCQMRKSHAAANRTAWSPGRVSADAESDSPARKRVKQRSHKLATRVSPFWAGDRVRRSLNRPRFDAASF